MNVKILHFLILFSFPYIGENVAHFQYPFLKYAFSLISIELDGK